jgi:hypothetical protein
MAISACKRQMPTPEHASPRSYYSLLPSPVLLSRPGPLETPRYFDSDTFPSFAGTGMALAFWYRHCDPGDFPTCGLYLFYKHTAGMQSASVCWSLWMEDNGIYYDNPRADPPYGYPVGFMPSKLRVTHRAWRHVVFALDAADDTVALFVDGEEAYRAPWGSPVAEADCGELPGLAPEDRPGDVVALGHQFPGYTYGGEVEMHDVRMYVGAALAPEDVRALAASPTPAPLTPELRCHEASAPEMRDTAWRNAYGQTCSWLSENRAAYPGLCALPPGMKDCPIACQTKQECFSNRPPPRVFWAWDRIRYIGAKAPRGTVCLSSSLDANRVVEDCRRWAASGAPSRDWPGKEEWLEGMASADAARLNVTDCDELAEAIDTECAFNAAAIEGFTEAVREGGGDYTVAFWMKPVGGESLEGGRFFPQAHFMASLSPPQHNLMIGKTTMNSNGESRVYTSCFSGKGRFFEYTELKPTSSDGWTFVAFTRDNSSTQTLNSLVTNLVQNEMIGEFRQCFYNDSAMFSAIEFNYPMLVSPIMLIPEILPLARLQETYYSLDRELEIRYGPAKPRNVERVQFGRYERIGIEKKNYLPRLALIATPIVFQQRVSPSPQCPTSFGGDWIRAQHTKVINSTCAPPYQCPADVLERPELSISCAGPMVDNGTYYGLESMRFEGRRGYAELLFSITEHDKLFREGQLLPTAAFFDSLTTAVQLILVFFSPQYGMTSVMTVRANLGGPSPLDVTVDVEHVEIVEGAKLLAVIVTLALLFFALVLLLMYVRRDILKIWTELKSRNAGKVRSTSMIPGPSLCVRCVVLCIDITTLALVPTAAIKLILLKLNSAELSRAVVGSLSSIPWNSSEVPMTSKKEAFFSNVETLLQLVKTETTTESLLYIAFLINIFRIIQGTSLHPRLALLEGTLSRAADDLWHTCLLIVLVLCCFSAVGTWRFGSTQKQFGSFSATLRTELKMMIEGSFFEGWDETLELQIFTILYLATVNILVLNFLLAVVVNSYMDIRAHNKEQLYVQEFITDIFSSLIAALRGKYSGWPTQRKLGELLGQYNAKLNIGYDDLIKTELFRNPQAVASFIKYYRQYHFLLPAVISKFGKRPAKKEDHMITDIERRIARLIGTTPFSLKDEAARAVSRSNSKRASSFAFRANADLQLEQIAPLSIERSRSLGYKEIGMMSWDNLDSSCQTPMVYEQSVAGCLNRFNLDVNTCIVDSAVKRLGTRALLIELGAINSEQETGLVLSVQERSLLSEMLENKGALADSGSKPFFPVSSRDPTLGAQESSVESNSDNLLNPCEVPFTDQRSVSWSDTEFQRERPNLCYNIPEAVPHLELESILLRPDPERSWHYRTGLPSPALSRDRSPASTPRPGSSIAHSQRTPYRDQMVRAQVCFDTTDGQNSTQKVPANSALTILDVIVTDSPSFDR